MQRITLKTNRQYVAVEMSSRFLLLLVGNFLSKKRGTRYYCEDLAVHLRGAGYKVAATSSQPDRIMRCLDMACTAALANYEIACIEVYSGPSFRWAEMMANIATLRKKPVVLILHGGRLPEFIKKQPVRGRRLLKKATLVTTPSNYIKTALTYIRGDIRCIPNGVDLTNYTWCARTVVSPRMVWLRAFGNTYNPELAVRTFARVRKFAPAAKLTMVGPVREREVFNATRDLIKQLGLEDAVELRGAVPKAEVPSLLSQFDIFLNTTSYESFGIAVVEAAACGLSIVSTKVGELPYLWQDHEDLLLVAPNDDEAMAMAVGRLLQDRELAHRLSVNARKKVEQFTWEKIIPIWETTFHAAAAKRTE